MIERELTALEHRLYRFLDDIDTIVEYDCDYEKWNRIREKMKRCKEDCKAAYGVVNNGYSLHIELPFDVDKVIAEKDTEITQLQAMPSAPKEDK